MKLSAYRQDLSDAYASLDVHALTTQAQSFTDSHRNNAISFYCQTSTSQKWCPKEYFQQSGKANLFNMLPVGELVDQKSFLI